MSSLAAICQPILGYTADRRRAISRTLILCISACAVLTPAVYMGRRYLAFLLPAYGLLSLFQRSSGPLLDSWISCSARQDARVHYSMARGFGSLGQALCALLAGIIIDMAGFGCLYLTQTTMLCLLAAMAIHYSRHHQMSAAQASGHKALPKESKYWKIVLCCVILYLGVSVDISYMPVLFIQCGGTSSLLGIAMFLMSCSEVLGMFLYGSFRRTFSAEALFSASLLCYSLKLLATCAAESWQMLMLIQLLQGGCFGLFMPSLVELIQQHTASEQTAVAMTLSSALYNGLGCALGTAAAGMISQYFGIRIAFLAGFVMCLTAFVLYVRTAISRAISSALK